MGNLMSNKTKEEREEAMKETEALFKEKYSGMNSGKIGIPPDPHVLKAEEVFMIIKMAKKYPYHDQTIRDVYLMIGDWDKTEECLSTSATLGHNPELVAKIMTS